MAATRGIGILSGRPDGAAEGLARYWTRAAGSPRVTACRLLRAGEPLDAFLERWQTDPVREWATHLVVQTQPPDATFEEHLSALRGLVRCTERANPGVLRNHEAVAGDLLIRPLRPRTLL